MSVSGGHGGGNITGAVVSNSSMKSNSDAQQQWLKAHSIEANVLNVKFAGEQARDRLYESKEKKKLIRVLTVTGYIFTVSLAAIMLSLYYVFFYPTHHRAKAERHSLAAAFVKPDYAYSKGTVEQAVYPFYDPTTETYEPYLPSPRVNTFMQKLLSTYQTNLNGTF